MAIPPSKTIIALDVGEKRIGVATASVIARLPSPYGVIDRNDQSFEEIKRLIKDHQAEILIVGLPRGLNGQDTAQTMLVKAFVKQLKQELSLPIHLQDEALTSVKAHSELGEKARYNKEAVDALAATYILGDFLTEHSELISEA